MNPAFFPGKTFVTGTSLICLLLLWLGNKNRETVSDQKKLFICCLVAVEVIFFSKTKNTETKVRRTVGHQEKETVSVQGSN